MWLPGSVALSRGAASLTCSTSPAHFSEGARLKLETMASIVEAAEQGNLVPTSGRAVPLSDAIAAITELETTGMPKGRLVILP